MQGLTLTAIIVEKARQNVNCKGLLMDRWKFELLCDTLLQAVMILYF